VPTDVGYYYGHVSYRWKFHKQFLVLGGSSLNFSGGKKITMKPMGTFSFVFNASLGPLPVC